MKNNSMMVNIVCFMLGLVCGLCLKAAALTPGGCSRATTSPTLLVGSTQRSTSSFDSATLPTLPALPVGESELTSDHIDAAAVLEEVSQNLIHYRQTLNRIRERHAQEGENDWIRQFDAWFRIQQNRMADQLEQVESAAWHSSQTSPDALVDNPLILQASFLGGRR